MRSKCSRAKGPRRPARDSAGEGGETAGVEQADWPSIAERRRQARLRVDARRARQRRHAAKNVLWESDRRALRRAGPAEVRARIRWLAWGGLAVAQLVELLGDPWSERSVVVGGLVLVGTVLAAWTVCIAFMPRAFREVQRLPDLVVPGALVLDLTLFTLAVVVKLHICRHLVAARAFGRVEPPQEEPRPA